MRKFLWKLALQLTVPVLCGLIVVNAYLAWRNLALVRRSTGQRLAASQMQAGISTLAFDLQEMETSQRGYLLTGDALYRKSYDDAHERLTAHIAALPSRLSAGDRTLETQVESAIAAKLAEMNETIHLREQGYRHRAFLIEGSNRGKQLMDEARASLDALSAAQARDAVRSQQELDAGASQAARRSAYANAALLVLAVIILFALKHRIARLELAYTRHDQQLRAANLRLERFAATVFRDLRLSVEETEGHAGAVLSAYEDFLPRQGREKLESIAAGARHMLATLDDLAADRPPRPPAEAVEIAAVRSLSA